MRDDQTTGPAPDHASYRYHPYYCEENAYLLCKDLAGSHRRLQVVFISNTVGACLFYNQRAAPPGKPLIWDYHVMLLDGPHRISDGTGASSPFPAASRYRILDFDTRLKFGIDAVEYLHATFQPLAPPPYQPRFRLVPAREYLATFSTDRRHMRRWEGDIAREWLQPPPPWDAPCGPDAGSAHELSRFIAMETGGPGVVVDLAELLEMIR